MGWDVPLLTPARATFLISCAIRSLRNEILKDVGMMILYNLYY